MLNRNFEYSLCLQKCEELAEWAGPSHVLQDMCERPVSHHPLSQQVSYSSWSTETFFYHHLSEITNKYSTSSTLNRENKPQKGGICVANHTSPIDIVILANDGCYAMVSITNRLGSLSRIPDAFYVMTSPLFAPSDRWVRSMEGWWESSRGPWWGHALMSGLRDQRWKTDML